MTFTRAKTIGSIAVKPGTRISLVVSQFNREISDLLLKSCFEELVHHGVAKKNIRVIDVPGAFEIPWACQRILKKKSADAIIALGAVIRGETPHFDFIASEVSRGIMDLNLLSSCPIVFGILTTNNLKQSQVRARGGRLSKGAEFARTALQLLTLNLS